MKILSQLPDPKEFAPYYRTYIDLVDEGENILELLEDLHDDLFDFFDEISVSKHNYKYAEGKWTVKQILQHLMDCERVFAYRALRIARQDQTPLPGFDEDAYAAVCDVTHRDLDEMLDEFNLIRQSSVALFRSFNEAELLSLGKANEQPLSVRAIPYIMAGHVIHHLKVIEERYL